MKETLKELLGIYSNLIKDYGTAINQYYKSMTKESQNEALETVLQVANAMSQIQDTIAEFLQMDAIKE